MSDVRALLKAKTKEREKRITHPYAAYNNAGQLRCTVCAVAIKHASAWDGHLGSKPHRTNVVALKQAELDENRNGKRKASEEREEDEDSAGEPRKRQRTTEPEGAVPVGFFSDPSRTFPPQSPSPEEGEHNGQPIDSELAEFEASLLRDEETTKKDVFDRATVFAEPQLNDEPPAGFPPSTSLNQQPQASSTAAEPLPEETEQETRKRKEEEEKELIMDRLVEEERAQEEADAKVTSLKTRLELVKKQREAARLKKLQK